MAESRFSNGEAEAILGRAISIQAEDSLTLGGQQGQTSPSNLVKDATGAEIELADLRAIASEAGIEVSALERAINEHQTGALSALAPCKRSRHSGGIALDRDLPHYLTDEDWMELVRAMRRLSKKQGKFEYVPTNIEMIWSTVERSGDINPAYVLSAARGQDGSTVRLELLHSTSLGLYRAFAVGLLVIGAAIFMAGTWVAPLVLAGLGVLMWVGGELEVRRRTDRSAQALNDAVDQVIRRHQGG